MNTKGRPWRIHPDDLQPLIRERREKGESHKQIALALSYSYDRIRRLCSIWGIRKLKRVRTQNQC